MKFKLMILYKLLNKNVRKLNNQTIIIELLLILWIIYKPKNNIIYNYLYLYTYLLSK